MYVIDASAINHVGRQATAPGVFDVLLEMIESHEMCFPDEVLDELERLAKGEHAYTWAKAAGASRLDRGAAYKHLVAVTHLVPALVDAEAEYESSAPCVLAQARSLQLAGFSVRVVTEDVRDKPTRISLAAACAQLDMSWCAVSQCLRDEGHGDLCQEPIQ
jgi:hypothetical protein